MNKVRAKKKKDTNLEARYNPGNTLFEDQVGDENHLSPFLPQ